MPGLLRIASILDDGKSVHCEDGHRILRQAISVGSGGGMKVGNCNKQPVHLSPIYVASRLRIVKFYIEFTLILSLHFRSAKEMFVASSASALTWSTKSAI